LPPLNVVERYREVAKGRTRRASHDAGDDFFGRLTSGAPLYESLAC